MPAAHKRLLIVLLAALTLAGAGAAAVNQSAPGSEMTAAARAFLAALDDAQRNTATMGFDDERRLGWHFIPKNDRKGLQLRDMTEPQRKAAHVLLRAALSEAGYGKATKIMQLDAILRDLQRGGGGAVRDPMRYYFTVFGTPAEAGKWGLSVEGHHLSLNFVVADNKLSAHTPAFLGSNPSVVQSDGLGFKKGEQVLKQEETLAFDLLSALSDGQKGTAVIAERAPRDIRAAGEPHPPADAPAGLPASKMNDKQQAILLQLIDVYANTMPTPVANARLEEIRKAGIGTIHFAWAGAQKPGVGHYYRVQGPTFVIEMANTQPDAHGNPASHVHAVWRDMRGDFGIAR
jgi:hypothetical protein